LPALGSARVLPAGDREAQFTALVANNFTGRTIGSETLLFDGETHRLNISLRLGVRHETEWGLEVPIVAHRGGFFDSIIQNWHQLIGSSQEGRDQLPRDQLNYRYIRGGVTQFDVTRAGSGIGDLRVTGAHQLNRYVPHEPYDLALRVSLKLPTGDETRLFGSGGADLAVWLSARCHDAACPRSRSWYGGAGLLFVGGGKVLPAQQRDLVAFGSAGYAWGVWPRLTLKVQLDGHSAFYKNSVMRQIDAASLQLVLGGTWQWSKKTALDMGAVEDLVADTAPDATMLVSIRTRF